jgi:hypothetical protein
MKLHLVLPFILGKVLVDSGPPPSNLPFGVAITSTQSAAILISKTCKCRLKAIHFWVNSELLVSTKNQINVSLCHGKKDEPDITNCIEESVFKLPNRNRIELIWESKIMPNLDRRQVWLVVGGNADSFEHSFSWLDAASFNATTAFYIKDDDKWIIEPNRANASTVKVEVVKHRCLSLQ